jgi:hypothetical protein
LGIKTLPASLGGLLHLEELKLDECQVLASLPSFGMLAKLRKLDLSGCNSLGFSPEAKQAIQISIANCHINWPQEFKCCSAGHVLTSFRPPNHNHGCDLCGAGIKKGASILRCLTCDYDLCGSCGEVDDEDDGEGRSDSEDDDGGQGSELAEMNEMMAYMSSMMGSANADMDRTLALAAQGPNVADLLRQFPPD